MCPFPPSDGGVAAPRGVNRTEPNRTEPAHGIERTHLVHEEQVLRPESEGREESVHAVLDHGQHAVDHSQRPLAVGMQRRKKGRVDREAPCDVVAVRVAEDLVARPIVAAHDVPEAERHLGRRREERVAGDVVERSGESRAGGGGIGRRGPWVSTLLPCDAARQDFGIQDGHGRPPLDTRSVLTLVDHLVLLDERVRLDQERAEAIDSVGGLGDRPLVEQGRVHVDERPAEDVLVRSNRAKA